MTSDGNIFLSPVLKGARFEQHGLPLDVMRDFYMFDEMLKSVAKRLFFHDHPERKRVPRNFLEDISLQVTGLEEGSTILNISLICLSANLLPTPAQVYAEKARECIIRTISAAERGTLDCNEPKYMNREDLTMFDRFGCSLQEGESIEFPMTGTGSNAVLNREVRRKLASHAMRSEYQESVSVYGAVSELDQDRETFTLNTVDGQRIPVKNYSVNHTEDIMKAMNLYRSGQKVLLNGIGVYAPSGKLESIDSIENITLLDKIDFGYRLMEIGELKAGWQDGACKAFDKSRLNRLNKLFQSNYTLDEDPYLFPVEDDILQAEWPHGDWKMSMEINLSTLEGDFYAVNLKSDAEILKTFHLDSPEDWKALCKVLSAPDAEVQA